MTEQIENEIRLIAKDRFPFDLVQSFISAFQRLVIDKMPLDYFLQISTDEGNELELGFFTNSQITDVTLSNGKIYFYTYDIASISDIQITHSNSKSTLTIQGEKKFDYNVVKPGAIAALSKYEKSLQAWIFAK